MTSFAPTTTGSQPRTATAAATAAGAAVEFKTAPAKIDLVDLVVIGGGIVGLGTAWAYLQKHPGRSVVVLEKEPAVGRHQSGHNSGVLHSGIYYKPGSVKSAMCLRGRALLEAFCREQGVAIEVCGKVIVATRGRELPMLNRLFERGRAQGIRCEMLRPERLKQIEPHATGLAALHVHEAGITDFSAVCAALARCIREAGGQIITGSAVQDASDRSDMVTLETDGGGATTWRAAAAVNCAGLHSDRIARMAGVATSLQIVPFRGEYYKLKDPARHLCRNLIYPVPDPALPFLGVHFTRMIGGGVECGPNAVLALAREGYTWRDVDKRDLWEALRSRPFWAMAERHWPTGIAEMVRSTSKRLFVMALQRLVPGIRAEHLERAGSGVRAQAIGRDGNLLEDFEIQRTLGGRMVHVLNAPSPAATGALAIGEFIVDSQE